MPSTAEITTVPPAPDDCSTIDVSAATSATRPANPATAAGSC